MALKGSEIKSLELGTLADIPDIQDVTGSLVQAIVTVDYSYAKDEVSASKRHQYVLNADLLALVSKATKDEIIAAVEGKLKEVIAVKEVVEP